MVYAVRGAAGVETDENSEMCEAVQRLVTELCERNSVSEEQIVSIVFSQTRDLVHANPARCLRRIGFAAVPLFCTQEPEYPDAQPRIVRVLMTYRAEEEHTPRPVYLGRAASLRPDLS
jgi:chorismate mutase